jgi:CBS domain-containing protein
MTPVAITITQGTTMRDAAAIMIKERLHRLCVVEEETGKLTGVLSTSDVMRDVLTTVRRALPESEGEGSGDDLLSP